jgi:DNA-binding phage protein
MTLLNISEPLKRWLLEACLEEADGDAAFVAKALGDIARVKGRDQGASTSFKYSAPLI